MLSTSEKSVKLPTFDGSPKNFQIWWVRFVAYARVVKFHKSISKDALDPDMPGSEAEELNATDDAGKKKIAAKNRNAVTMANLSMAFTREATMGLIYKAMAQDWPKGLAHLVVKGLFKKYQPQDTLTRVALRQMLNKITMRKGSNPTKLFQQIAGVVNRYNTVTKKIPEDELIAVVLDKSPNEYKARLTAEKRVKAASVTLKDLESAMNQHWRQIG
jgi:gag-polypeptide of LTR copia-type